MNTYRAFRCAAAILMLGIAIFVLALLFVAKPLYALHADLFQAGHEYQGETRALLYNRFLFHFIAPLSLSIGTLLAWAFIKTKKFVKRKKI